MIIGNIYGAMTFMLLCYHVEIDERLIKSAMNAMSAMPKLFSAKAMKARIHACMTWQHRPCFT